MPAPSTLTRWFPLALILALSGAREASAEVFLPTGEYRVAMEDLRIKVRNGEVVLARSWKADDLNRGEFRWHPNMAWEGLRFRAGRDRRSLIDGASKPSHRPTCSAIQPRRKKANCPLRPTATTRCTTA